MFTHIGKYASALFLSILKESVEFQDSLTEEGKVAVLSLGQYVKGLFTKKKFLTVFQPLHYIYLPSGALDFIKGSQMLFSDALKRGMGVYGQFQNWKWFAPFSGLPCVAFPHEPVAVSVEFPLEGHERFCNTCARRGSISYDL